jgi:hypothetical protein
MLPQALQESKPVKQCESNEREREMGRIQEHNNTVKNDVE